MPIQFARNTHTGEIHVQTSSASWRQWLEEWKQERLAKSCLEVTLTPSPMPMGHLMFSKRDAGSVYAAFSRPGLTWCIGCGEGIHPADQTWKIAGSFAWHSDCAAEYNQIHTIPTRNAEGDAHLCSWCDELMTCLECNGCATHHDMHHKNELELRNS